MAAAAECVLAAFPRARGWAAGLVSRSRSSQRRQRLTPQPLGLDRPRSPSPPSGRAASSRSTAPGSAAGRLCRPGPLQRTRRTSSRATRLQRRSYEWLGSLPSTARDGAGGARRPSRRPSAGRPSGVVSSFLRRPALPAAPHAAPLASPPLDPGSAGAATLACRAHRSLRPRRRLVWRVLAVAAATVVSFRHQRDGVTHTNSAAGLAPNGPQGGVDPFASARA